MEPLIDRIRAYVAAIPTHRCDGCELDFTSETMTCPSCGIADRTRWIADSDANRLLREVAAHRPVGCITPISMIQLRELGGKHHVRVWRPNFASEKDTFVYTLTGATHE